MKKPALSRGYHKALPLTQILPVEVLEAGDVLMGRAPPAVVRVLLHDFHVYLNVNY